MSEMDKHCCEGPLVDSEAGSVNNSKLDHILKANGIFQEVAGVKVVVEPELPVHFTSICNFVTVKFSKLKKLELFVKKLKENAEIKEEDDYSLFEKESNVYTQVMPALRELCESRTG